MVDDNTPANAENSPFALCHLGYHASSYARLLIWSKGLMRRPKKYKKIKTSPSQRVVPPVILGATLT